MWPRGGMADTKVLGTFVLGRPGSSPGGATKFADVVELADTLASNPSA
jgi:hypothetical protein